MQADPGVPEAGPRPQGVLRSLQEGQEALQTAGLGQRLQERGTVPGVCRQGRADPEDRVGHSALRHACQVPLLSLLLNGKCDCVRSTSRSLYVVGWRGTHFCV